MSSINTNAAAMTALQTLKATNKALDITQNRISTGYRVSEAAHNAAYWSIATTMRSDNNAMSTVKDALGLGAAQVDIAYTAMDVVKDTLDQIKKKLVAASQPDIDRAKIQEEIVQLQNDLQTYAKSATFSGGNWLDVEETSNQKVVASFIRDASGAVSLETIDVDTSKVALFTGNKTGLLQGNVDLSGGVPDVSEYTAAATAVAAGGNTDFTFAGFTGEKWNAGDTVSFNVVANDGTDDTELVFTGVFDGEAWTFSADAATPGDLTIAFDTSGADLVVNVANGHATDPWNVSFANFASSRSTGPDASGLGAQVEVGDGTADTVVTVAGAGGITWAEGDTLSFDLTIAGGDATRITGTYDGENWRWADVPDDVTVEIDANGDLVVTTAAALTAAGETVVVKNFSTASVTTVTDFDIRNLTRDQMQTLLNHVDKVLGRVTTAASDLGAIKTRIASQQDFVGKIMDAVSRGVGQLVDADMEEESTRLQALQVQQQLGIQALSIANANSQNILSLFRG